MDKLNIYVKCSMHKYIVVESPEYMTYSEAREHLLSKVSGNKIHSSLKHLGKNKKFVRSVKTCTLYLIKKFVTVICTDSAGGQRAINLITAVGAEVKPFESSTLFSICKAIEHKCTEKHLMPIFQLIDFIAKCEGIKHEFKKPGASFLDVLMAMDYASKLEFHTDIKKYNDVILKHQEKIKQERKRRQDAKKEDKKESDEDVAVLKQAEPSKIKVNELVEREVDAASVSSKNSKKKTVEVASIGKNSKKKVEPEVDEDEPSDINDTLSSDGDSD
jgi:hypothetical protein